MTAEHPTLQAQARSTCPACDGRKFIEGRTVEGGLSTTIIACPRCDAGTVPAGPQADLAQWREEMKRLLDDSPEWSRLFLRKFQDHLAAMPQPEPVELPLVVAKRIFVAEDFAHCDERVPHNLRLSHEDARAMLAAIAQAEQGAAG